MASWMDGADLQVPSAPYQATPRAATIPPMTWKPWQFLTVAIAGWMNRQQQDALSYLKTENRILREKLGQKRLILVWGKGGPYGKRGKRRVVPLIPTPVKDRRFAIREGLTSRERKRAGESGLRHMPAPLRSRLVRRQSAGIIWNRYYGIGPRSYSRCTSSRTTG